MYVKPYIYYYIEFHSKRDYFECHEILEEYWKQDDSPNRHVWVGLIQLAVGLYHYRRGNFLGAQKMITSFAIQLQAEKEAFIQLGIDVALLCQQIHVLLQNIHSHHAYYDFIIPLADINLLEYLYFHTSINQTALYCESNLSNDYLLNKHTRRDRSDIINHRLLQLKKRHKKKK